MLGGGQPEQLPAEGKGGGVQEATDRFDGFYVKSSRCNIGGHQHIDLFIFEAPARATAQVPEKLRAASSPPPPPIPVTAQPDFPSMGPNLPESLQALRLREVAMKLTNAQPQKSQQDVQAMRLLLGLGEEHHMVWERPSQQG